MTDVAVELPVEADTSPVSGLGEQVMSSVTVSTSVESVIVLALTGGLVTSQKYRSFISSSTSPSTWNIRANGALVSSFVSTNTLFVSSVSPRMVFLKPSGRYANSIVPEYP